jgi:hypothetical protein
MTAGQRREARTLARLACRIRRVFEDLEWLEIYVAQRRFARLDAAAHALTHGWWRPKR